MIFFRIFAINLHVINLYILYIMTLRKTALSFLVIGCLFANQSVKAMDNSANNTTEQTITTYQDYQFHTVLRGETVYSIASAYNTTVKEIYRLNPEAEKGIKTGDSLKIPTVKLSVVGYNEHTIKSQETLYGISRLYSMSIEDIVTANPGLNESSFKSGKTIRIPVYGNSQQQVEEKPKSSIIEHKVKKGDTLYRIGKNYDASEEALVALNPILKENGLKEGMVLIIPQKRITGSATSYQDDNLFRIGILLPFLDTKGSVQQDKLIEYYEGLLLAVRDMKEKGLNAEIYTFDSGAEKDTKKLESILATNEMNNIDLVIGGISKQQIDVLSKFSKKKGVKYVVPFSSQIQDINMNSNIFQVTTPPSNLFAEIAYAFRNKLGDRNIIFVSEVGSDNNKSDFIAVLKKELAKYNISSKTIGSSANLGNELKSAIDPYKQNIVIPTSSSEATLRRVTLALKSVSQAEVSLFGYPDWQTYTALSNDLHNFDSYIYSIFYYIDQDNNTQRFAEQFKTWYNKDLINSYPRFACLGYDTGLYFLTALNQYGRYFETNISTISAPTLQSAIHFNQINNRGGYINNGLYFVHYKTNSTIEKIDCNK